MTAGEEAMTMVEMAVPAATAREIPTEDGLPLQKEISIPPPKEAAALLPGEAVVLLPKEGVLPSHPAGDIHPGHPPAGDGHPVILPATAIPVLPPGVIPVIPVSNVMQADNSPAGPDGLVMAAVPIPAAAAAPAADNFV